ncbi:hypothetical protein PIB30_026388 [Stylosanthes scabra]|uniref:Uncharacterized protein n=1 Tax=Stylosanthes scabra TaxID=79078 RepID=A0ABU6RAM1_9FABA|nr:hypothetical protein [Stylosanthes scabra]
MSVVCVSKEPISVCWRSSTTLVKLQNTILQKFGVTGSKRVSDADFEVIFHCRRDFLKVGKTELYAKLADVVASSGRSNPNPTSDHIGGSSSSAPVAQVVQVIPPCIASPSFMADLHHEDDDECDLGDNRTFGELVAAVTNSSHNVRTRVQISEPEGIEDALGDDEDEEETKFIVGDSDDDHPSIPAEHGRPSNSESHQ